MCTLLNQDYKPDKVILWLAKEQFPSINDIPQKIQDLQKYGLTIGWWQDIRSYKKLIPALHEYPNAIIVTVDDDWYYRRDMLKILVEEHQKYPNEIICHAITHPELTDDNKLRMVKEDNEEYRAKSSYFNKILSGSGVLFKKEFLDDDVLKEELFMEYASTNDDIWFWAMAVKKGTKIRYPEKAHGCVLMTDADNQGDSSLALYNSANGLYHTTTDTMLREFPIILERLLAEQN